MSFTIEELFDLIPEHVRAEPGHVFHASRSALTQRGGLYILGLNPSGRPEEALAKGLTIERQMDEVLGRADGYSEYLDSSWDGREPGAAPIQVRMNHLIEKLGHDIRSIPASNLIFYCTKTEADLKARKDEFLSACWPFHRAIIERCEVSAIICMGNTVGAWVRDKLDARKPAGEFIETNKRRWKSQAHRNAAGVHVFTLNHPSRANWTAPDSNPSDLLLRALSARP